MPLTGKQETVADGRSNGEASLPEPASDVGRLELLLSDPSEAVVSLMKRLSGDILFLGAGGKIGPSIAQMAKRASDQANTPRRVIAVSRLPTATLCFSMLPTISKAAYQESMRSYAGKGCSKASGVSIQRRL
jgi:hypothetical protein